MRNGDNHLFSAGCLDDIEALLALVGNVSPILSGNLLLGEELRTHADAEYASGEPLLEVLLLGCYATSDHDLAPRHGSLETLDHVGAIDITGEELGEVAAELLSLADLTDSAAARAVSHEATVADGGNLGVEEGTNDKVSAKLEIESRGSGIYDRADAESELGALLVSPLNKLTENLLGEIATVGELESADATLIASLHNILANLKVLVVEDGDHASLTDLGEDCNLIKFSHFGFFLMICAFLSHKHEAKHA